MANNQLNLIKNIKPFLHLLIFRGSLILNLLYNENNINVKRKVKDLDADLKIVGYNNQIKNLEIIQSLSEHISRFFGEETIIDGFDRIKSIKFLSNNFLFVKNIIDISIPVTIEYKKYKIEDIEIMGSTVNQIIVDKLDACLKNKKGRILKDIIDIINIVENINFNLLEVCDCAKLCNINFAGIQGVFKNVQEALLREYQNFPDDNIHELLQTFEKFINKLYEAYKVSKIIKVNYPEKEIIQREYIPLTERNLISEDIYNNFWNLNNQSKSNTILANWD